MVTLMILLEYHFNVLRTVLEVWDGAIENGLHWSDEASRHNRPAWEVCMGEHSWALLLRRHYRSILECDRIKI
jgi:hypothetical protein